MAHCVGLWLSGPVPGCVRFGDGLRGGNQGLVEVWGVTVLLCGEGVEIGDGFCDGVMNGELCQW